MILLLLACAPDATPWTAEGALAPHLARLDTDGDGRVSAAEYARTRREGPPFATADLDGDGALEAAELVWLVRAQSPTTFDGDVAPIPAGLGVGVDGAGEDGVGEDGAGVPGARPDERRGLSREARHVWEIAVWMGDAVRAAGGVGPPPAMVEAAVRSGRMDSAETQALLATLRPAWEAQGWAWPAF